MVAPALSMDASQRVYLAQNSCKRIQSQTCLSYVECSRIYLKDAKPQRPDNEILGPDEVRRYTVNVYLVKDAKPLQWMLASTSLSEAFAFFFLSSEAEITEKTYLCDLVMDHRSH